MYRFDDVRLRRFRKEDIPKKIAWINNPLNNRYLHYDLPLEEEKTLLWYEKIKERNDRYDAIIEYHGAPVGLIGLLNIDKKNKKAEEYITIGEQEAKGKGVATKAGILLSAYAFLEVKLNKLYCYIETGNEPSLRLFAKRGFSVEGILQDDLCMNDRFVDRKVLALFAHQYLIPSDAYWENVE